MIGGLLAGLKSRWGRGLLTLAFVAACAAAVAAGTTETRGSDVLAVRFGGDDGETRIVIDLARSTSAHLVAADSSDQRMVLALKGVSAANPLQGKGRGLVRAWTVDDDVAGARLSLDLAQGADITRRFLLPPADGVANYRYVVDIAARPAAGSALATGVARPLVAVHTLVAPLPPLRLKKVVVVDAGHGGKDPGAGGANSNEKDVTLAAALALKARLERTGRYQVVMTRDSDVFVPLETRVQIARRAGADLFLSLHADSGGDLSVHGASIYTLSERGGARVTHVLDRHDWFLQPKTDGDDRAVGEILLDLTQRATRNRSSVFAEDLLEHIGDQTPLLQRSHRDAGYFVLLAPDVPAALLEMGFITNPDDERRLNDADERRALMDKVADAIDAYFAGQTPQTTLASR